MLFVFPPPNRKWYWAHFPARWLGWAELGNSVQLVFHAQLWKMYVLRNILTPPMVQEPTLIHVGFRTHASPRFDTFLDHFGLLLLFCGSFFTWKKNFAGKWCYLQNILVLSAIQIYGSLTHHVPGTTNTSQPSMLELASCPWFPLTWPFLLNILYVFHFFLSLSLVRLE